MGMLGRLALHEELCNILGSRYCYFRPTDDTVMHYPCIIYERVNANTRFANNSPYNIMERYTVTLVDEDPDSELIDRIEMLPLCSYDRHYYAEGLNHDVFTLFHV